MRRLPDPASGFDGKLGFQAKGASEFVRRRGFGNTVRTDREIGLMLLRNVIGAVPLVFAAAIGLAQPTLQPFPLGVPPGTSSDRSIRGARL